MERADKFSSDPSHRRPLDERRAATPAAAFGPDKHPTTVVRSQVFGAIEHSPRMVAQRERLAGWVDAAGRDMRRPQFDPKLTTPKSACDNRNVGLDVVQRDVEPGNSDPLDDMMKVGSKSLLYGASSTRAFTSTRATKTNQEQWAKEKRTIDAYNDEIGLSALMKSAEPRNIFKVREALAKGDVVSDWGSIVPPEKPTYATDPDLVAWLLKLKERADWIGLTDLGGDAPTTKEDKASLKRVKSGRYKKNFISKARYKTREKGLTPEFIHDWLGRSQTFDGAALTLSNMTKDLSGDLARWITKAFWRRTSKLGIDFTVGRGHTIHMNTAADSKFDFSKGGKMKMKPGDLRKMKETYGRMITTSEYRHLAKGIKKGTIDPRLVNFYDEVT